MMTLLIGAVTIGDLAIALAFVAGVLSSILIIWAFTDKFKKSRDTNIAKIIDEALEKYDRGIGKRIDTGDTLVQREITKDLQSLSIKLDNFIKWVEETAEKDKESHDLYRESIIETYKRDIRNIYYNLRETGTVSDHDKAYVDKIYPRYKALGGNSDIAAKYAEMCAVHEKITQDAYDKAREEYFRKRIEDEKNNQEE